MIRITRKWLWILCGMAQGYLCALPAEEGRQGLIPNAHSLS